MWNPVCVRLVDLHPSAAPVPPQKKETKEVMGSKNGKPVLREEDAVALSHSSGMTKEEVRDAFNAFVAEHPNGK